MAKCLYSYRDDLPKSLFKVTAQEPEEGGTLLQEANQDVPPDGVAFSRRD